MGLLGSDKPAQGKAQPQSTDEQAIARYRYMLKTAPPETIEQAHAEAFAHLTPEHRGRILRLGAIHRRNRVRQPRQHPDDGFDGDIRNR